MSPRKCPDCGQVMKECDCDAERRRLEALRLEWDGRGRPSASGQEERIQRYAALVAAGKKLFE